MICETTNYPRPCYRFNKVSFTDDQPQRLYAYFSNAIALSSTDSNNENAKVLQFLKNAMRIAYQVGGFREIMEHRQQNYSEKRKYPAKLSSLLAVCFEWDTTEIGTKN